MYIKKFIFSLTILFISAAIVLGQNRTLTLSEALALARENNLTGKSALARMETAKAQYRMTNSVFLPGLEVSYTGVSTNDPLAAFGFKLKQEIVTQADFVPATLNEPGSVENFQTKLEIQQPLLNMDGIYARKAAKKQLEAMTFQATRIGQNIRFEVKKAYYLLVLARESIAVFEKSVRGAEEALRLTRENEAQGLAKKADVLEASVRLEERKNQLLAAKNKKETANDFLVHLLAMSTGEQIIPVDSLVQPPVQVSLALNSIHIENRSDIRAFQKQVEAGQNRVKANQMKFIPHVNVLGTFEWNDDKFLGASANNYMLGASFSWRLFNGYKNAGAVQQSKALLNEARYNFDDYLSQSQIQIKRTLRKIQLNYHRIASGKRAKEQALESLRIRTNRFKQGLEKTADLLMAEALAAQKELEFIQAIYNYRQAVFEMELLIEKDINE